MDVETCSLRCERLESGEKSGVEEAKTGPPGRLEAQFEGRAAGLRFPQC
jgi:hypothetical protein